MEYELAIICLWQRKLLFSECLIDMSHWRLMDQYQGRREKSCWNPLEPSLWWLNDGSWFINPKHLLSPQVMKGSQLENALVCWYKYYHLMLTMCQCQYDHVTSLMSHRDCGHISDQCVQCWWVSSHPCDTRAPVPGLHPQTYSILCLHWQVHQLCSGTLTYSVNVCSSVGLIIRSKLAFECARCAPFNLGKIMFLVVNRSFGSQIGSEISVHHICHNPSPSPKSESKVQFQSPSQESKSKV